MSEAERRKRLNYKKNRKKLIFIQAVAMAVVLAFIAIFASVYYELDKTYYIDYTEKGSVGYKVQYSPNEFFDEEWQPSGQSYVPDLTETIRATFSYNLGMDASDVEYDYTYRIDATVLIKDNRITNGNSTIYSPVFPLVSPTTASQSSDSALYIYKTVDVDYSFYNDIAQSFMKEYGLSNVSCSLVVKMTVDVKGTSDDLISANQNTSAVSMTMPLNSNPFSITASSPSADENKVLAYKETANQNVYKGLAVAAGFIELALIFVFIAFVYLTRNHDVNYSIKVQKIVSSYKSFIQTITNGFDTEGYQILKVASFVEMLGIRDTIQSPILMSENTDQTRTQFFIPTNTKILYLFEIKVDDYDKLYSEHPEWIDDSVIEIHTTQKAEAEAAPVAEPSVENKAFESAHSEPVREAPGAESASAREKNAEQKSDSCERAVCMNALEVNELVKSATVAAVESAVREYSNLVVMPKCEPVEIEPRIKVVEVPVSIDHAHTADLVVSKLMDRLAKAEAAQNVKPSDGSDGQDTVIIRTERIVEPIKIATPITAEDMPKKAEAELQEPKAEESKAEETHTEVPEAAEQSELTTSIVVSEPEAVEADTDVKSEAVSAVEPALSEISEPAVTENSQSPESDDDSDDEDGTILYYDETGARLDIKCRRSCLANIIQSDNDTIKKYYSELKNYILSYKNVNARMSWRYETFKKGRYQLFRLKIRGKTICLYCALNPYEFDTAKYFHEPVDVKMFEQVPMLIRIRSDRGLKKAKELIDLTMEKFALKPNPRAVYVDYVASHPYERTQQLIDRELIKVLIPDGYVAIDPHHIVAAETAEQMAIANAAEEAGFASAEAFEEAIKEAMQEPDVELEEIDYVDEVDKAYEETEQKPGVEVIGVVWRERERGNKIYRYDPNGEVLNDGDEVLVPTKASSRDVIRKAAVAHGNHKVDPESITHPLKKVISVVKRKIENILSGE